jgi:teichuronic acid exporter
MNLKKQAEKSIFWSILIQFSFQFFGFLVTIILARILLPEQFGVVGMVAIFIALGRIVIDGGLASSLIRDKEVNQTDYSTIFFANLCLSVVFYVILLILAPYLALFFQQPELSNLLRVYGLVFIIGAFSTVQSVRLNKELDFKTQFKLLVPSLLVSSAMAVWMAYAGFGTWSLIVKELVFALMASIQIWIYSKWTPSFIFSTERFKHHFSFGSKIMVTELLNRFFIDSYKIVIGKFFSATQLGLYARAKSMEELPNTVLFNTINRVMYPLLAHVNDDDQRLKGIYRQIISTVAYLVVPVLTLLIILAKPLFVFLLTEKWNEAIPYFQILTLAALISPIQMYLLNICKVKGRSDLVLKLSIVEYGLIGFGLTSAIWLGMEGLLWSLVLIAFAKVLLSAMVAARLISYTLREQFMDIYQPYVFSVTAGFFVWLLMDLFYTEQQFQLGVLLLSSGIFFLLFGFLSFITKNKIFFKGIRYVRFQLVRFF